MTEPGLAYSVVMVIYRSLITTKQNTMSCRRVIIFCSVIICVCGAVNERKDNSFNLPNVHNQVRSKRQNKDDLLLANRGNLFKPAGNPSTRLAHGSEDGHGEHGQGERNNDSLNLPNAHNQGVRSKQQKKDDLLATTGNNYTVKGEEKPVVISAQGNTPIKVSKHLEWGRRWKTSYGTWRWGKVGHAQGAGRSDKFNPGIIQSEHRPTLQKAFKSASQPKGSDQVHPGKQPVLINIADHPACRKDVKALCTVTGTNYSQGSLTNNFAVIDCLQYDRKTDADVSDMCRNFVWSYKRNLTTDSAFDAAAPEVCKDMFTSFPDCQSLHTGSGHKILCLLEHKGSIGSALCQQFLVKMASIVFGDFRLVHKLADKCSNDIHSLSCGRLHKEGHDTPHSQGRTIECLSQNVKNLDRECKHEILRIAELQSHDYHMDRPLFYACREDRERYCKRTKAGGGKVFKCLFRHKFERDMSTDCREKLVVRQQLIREDYKVNKGLADSCRHDIRKYKCLKPPGGQLPVMRQERLSFVLLCLQGATQAGEIMTPECIGEMREMRRSLMEDYKINPNIVTQCANEISTQCGGGLQREGKTLHCLMDLARPKAREKEDKTWKTAISQQCLKELKDHLPVAGPGEDFRLDPALHEACQPVVDVACKDIRPGDARVISCLMEKIGTDKMTEECQERLMEIQFFVARDFKLSPRLYNQCAKYDAVLCQVTDWRKKAMQRESNQDGHTFPCLYRNMKVKNKLTRACAFEMKRVIRQRSISVELEPQIQEPCLYDLGFYCSEKTEKGEELYCLQDHFDNLRKECQLAVGNFTEDIDEDPQLDKILMKACTPMINKFCEGDTQPGDVMECLIKYKRNGEMNRKCAAGIERHQLMSLKDFRFSFKFKEACKKEVMQLCETNIRTKSAVVRCLSDTLLDEDHRLSKSCRKQLRFELLQRGEYIRLDPLLQGVCHTDMDRFCTNVTPGQGKVVECLKKSMAKLTPACHKKIFKRSRIEANEQYADYTLMSHCKKMINRHCQDEEPNGIVHCLQYNFNDQDFDAKCGNVVLSRGEIQSKDFRLNPILHKACRLDIPKFCKHQMRLKSEERELEGKVINCLKTTFRAKRLSKNCEDRTREVIKQASLDFKQDPVLVAACKYQIDQLCSHELAALADGSDGRGQVVECLKKQLTMGHIKEKKCGKEIARVLAEGKADIHVDPLLHRACALDLKRYCHDVPIGEGRYMSCLLSSLDDKTIPLKPECRKRLEDRVAMWEYAAKMAPPELVSGLTYQRADQASNYLAGFVCAVFALIIILVSFYGIKKIRHRRITGEAKSKYLEYTPL